MEGYKAAYPEAPAIIFDELMRQGEHRRSLEKEAIDRQEGRADWGQRYAFIIVLAVLAVCVYAVSKNEPAIAGVLFGVTLVSIVGTFIVGNRRQVSDLLAKKMRAEGTTPNGPPPSEPPEDTEHAGELRAGGTHDDP
jgi:hypothetical protein